MRSCQEQQIQLSPISPGSRRPLGSLLQSQGLCGGGLCLPVKWSTMKFCPSANSGEAERRQGPERTAAGTACTTGPGGHQRGGPCLLALLLCRRWLTLPGGTRNGMRLTGNASAVRPGQTHLPSTHPPLCRGQEWEEAPQTETASQNHQQLALSDPLWPLSSPPLQWSEGRDPGSLDALSCPVYRLDRSSTLLYEATASVQKCLSDMPCTPAPPEEALEDISWHSGGPKSLASGRTREGPCTPVTVLGPWAQQEESEPGRAPYPHHVRIHYTTYHWCHSNDAVT